MKKLVVAIVAIVAVTAFSCKKDDLSQTNVNIVVRSDLSESSTLKAATAYGTIGADELTGSALTASAVTLETFLINIDEIEFELEDNFDDYGDDFDDDTDEFKLKGPILVDLLSDEAGNGLVVAAGDLPNGEYEEIEVEFDKYTGDPSNKLYGHTILIEGLIDGQEMKMWYDGDFDIEIDFPDAEKNIALSGAEMSLYIDFYLNKMLDNLNAFDLSGVKDGNGNGIIEIGPDDVDGNNAYAHHFIEALMMSFELDDDDDDDDDDD